MKKINKNVIVSGISGQDGAYLAKLLLEKNNCKVIGTYRRTSHRDFWRIKELGIFDHPNLILVENDITDLSSTFRLLKDFKPHEYYNLASQSFVASSFSNPILTAQITGIGTLNTLEAIKCTSPNTKFIQASSSEMFGLVQSTPQNENTKFYPRSPYAVAKAFSHWITVNYRESHKLIASSAIMFNHESPMRGKEFVTRKITDGLAKIKLGHIDCIELGNLNSKRDWGYSEDYMRGLILMMSKDKPDDYVFSTGRSENVRSFVKICCDLLNFNIQWRGSGEKEIGFDLNTNKTIIRVNKDLFRPSEVYELIGDSTKAKNILNWSHEKSLEDLAKMMIEKDIERLRNNL